MHWMKFPIDYGSKGFLKDLLKQDKTVIVVMLKLMSNAYMKRGLVAKEVEIDLMEIADFVVLRRARRRAVADKLTLVCTHLIHNSDFIYRINLSKYEESLEQFSGENRIEKNRIEKNRIEKNNNETSTEVPLESVTKKPIKALKRNNLTLKDIDSIYEKYPRREGKREGYKRLQRLNAKRLPELIRAVDNYAEHVKINSTEKKYIKHFASWTSHWEDWIDMKPEDLNEVVEKPYINYMKKDYTNWEEENL